MKYKWDNKYLAWGITSFSVIAASVLLFFGIFKWNAIGEELSKLINILMPIIYGFIIAYLLNPIMMFFDEKLQKHVFFKVKKKEKVKKISKIFSIIITYILSTLCLGALLGMILPQVIESVEGIIVNFQTYMENLGDFVTNLTKDNELLTDTLGSMLIQLNNYIETEVYNDILPKVNVIFANLTSGVYIVFVTFKNIIIGLIVSIYILGSKDKFKAQSKKLLYGLLTPSRTDVILDIGRKCHSIFIGFISGKLLDSLIIGIIAFVVLSILKMPFVLLISVIIGVTNVIPFFGPFIGAIPCALIILLVNPLQCLYFVIFIIILQQIDGNIIGPKILGDSTGLSAFWVIVSILVGGGLFGFVGMLISVPTFAVIYTIVKEVIERRLKNKKLPVETEDYMNISNSKEMITSRKEIVSNSKEVESAQSDK